MEKNDKINNKLKNNEIKEEKNYENRCCNSNI